MHIKYVILTIIIIFQALGFDLKPFPFVTKWFKMAKDEIPGYYEFNQPGVDEVAKIAKTMLNTR